MNSSLRVRSRILVLTLLLVGCSAIPGFSQRPPQPPKPSGPWLDSSLSPDTRADMVLKELTLDEKITLIHGEGLAGIDVYKRQLPFWIFRIAAGGNVGVDFAVFRIKWHGNFLPELHRAFY